MPITLAQAQVNTANDVDYSVIDTTRRNSWLFDQIVFDNVVSPGTGGGTLTYGYTRLTTAPSASFRAINSEYTPGQAVREQVTVNLKPFGGAFNVDRVLTGLGAQASSEVPFQLQQLINSIPVRWGQEVILGDVAVDALGFDGLSKTLTGTDTEVDAATGGAADITPATIITQPLAMAALDVFDEWLSRIAPSRVGSIDTSAPGALPAGVKAILTNRTGLVRIRSLARWAGLYSNTKDDLGRQIEKYGDWVLVDLGDRHDSSGSIIPITASHTDYYAVTFGMDGLHGASRAGAPLMQTWLPDFTVAGAVKTGEVEVGPAAVILKSTKAAGVLRNVQVA